MSLKSCLASTSLLALAVAGSGTASAFCSHDAMSDTVSQIFKSAETKFFSGARSFEVLMTLAPLKGMPLNCFEAGRTQLLIAGVHMKDQDGPAAAEAFEIALDQDFLDTPARRDVLKALAGLYLDFDTGRASDAYDRWLATGVHPSVEEELTIAELHLTAGRLDRAFSQAESAYRESTTPEHKARADAIMSEVQKRRLGQ